MHSRFTVLTLAFCMMMMLLGCTSRPPSGDAANSASDTTGSSGGDAGAARMAASEAQPIVVPAGTVITVRLGQSLSSKTSQAGETFTATVATPVEAEGQTVIPSGAEAAGSVIAAHPAGKFKGASLLQIKLNAITVQGRQHAIETSSVARSEKGKGKRSAAMIGGGAGAGAIIGALAGGGKGAAIGALVGGGAGTAGAAFTGNRDVTLPAESVVSFKLHTPIEIR
jgi:hypothetical protein